MKKISSIAGESVDSCRRRSTNKKSVGTDFLASATTAHKKTIAPRSAEFYHNRTIRVLSTGSSIYPDACFLMNQAAPIFFAEFEQDFLRFDISFKLLTQVRQELETLSRFSNGERQEKATQALNLLKKHHRLFRYAPSDVDLYNADRAICREMFRNQAICNQILLTQDGDLAASILNLCGSVKAPGAQVETTVLRLNKYGYLSLFHINGMNLYSGISLPTDYLRANQAANFSITQTDKDFVPYQYAPSSYLLANQAYSKYSPDAYFEASIANGTCYITKDALLDAFDASGNNAFLNRLHQLYLKGVPVKVRILSVSLTDDIRRMLSMWMHLFEIVETAAAFYSEEDALIAAIFTEPYVGECLHQLLICHDPQLKEAIDQRRPSCFSHKQIWGTVITRDGYLFNTYHTRLEDNYSNCTESSSDLSA